MTTPRSFYIVGVLALLWNLMGDAAYLMQVTADLPALAEADPYQAKLFEQMPQWAWSAYAIAVWGGTLATVALLLRRRLAVPLYAVSLAAVLVQFGYSFLGTDLLAVKGGGAALFPAVIILIAIALLVHARRMAKRGILR